METISKKVAVFEYLEPSFMIGYQTVNENECAGLVRVSEWVEVEFPARDEAENLPEIVSGIDAEIESIKEKAMEEVAKLQTKKAELLALNHDK